MTDLLTVNQAAALLNSSRKKIYQLVRADKINMIKLGRSTRITAASVHRLIGEPPRPEVREADHRGTLEKLHAEVLAMREEIRGLREEVRSLRNGRWVISLRGSADHTAPEIVSVRS